MKNPSAPLLLLLVLALASPGCTSSDERSIPPARQGVDPVYAQLQTIDVDSFRDAFDSLSQYAFVREIRTVQTTATGEVLARKVETVRYDKKNGERETSLLSADSTGQFDYGFFGSFSTQQDLPSEPVDVGEFLLPDELPYLQARNLEAYTFASAPDTNLAGRRVRTVEVRVRPEATGDFPIRYVRHYFDPDTGRLIGLYLERESRTLLFTEQTTLFATLTAGPGNRLVPGALRTTVYLRLPLLSSLRFATESTFTDYTGPVNGQPG